MGTPKQVFVVLYPRNGMSSSSSNASSTPGDYRTETFESRVEAIQAVKKTPGARFKLCSSVEEAEKQLAVGTPSGERKKFPSETSPAPEVSYGFPSVSLPMLSGLRMTIEAGDHEKFKSLVWSNPKYLIGNGDSPTLLREGNWRRNGLHIAATAGRSEMVAAILGTIRDEKFLRLLYPEDSPDDLEFKASHLVELYLNNREMRKCNTPLHCAVAAGCVRSVELLVAAPECRRFEKNKENETPFDLISSGLEEWKVKRLTQLLGSGLVLCYDTAEGPKLEIRDASAAESAKTASQENRAEADDVEQGRLRAIAGPLPPGQLDGFVSAWKHGGGNLPDSRPSSPLLPLNLNLNRKRIHPPSASTPTSLDLKLGDYKKGMERIGRRLCRQHGVPWAERWDFLDDFLDICADDGLKKLDDYLAGVRDELLERPSPCSPEPLLEESFLQVVERLSEEESVVEAEEEGEDEAPMDQSQLVCMTPPRQKIKSSKLVLRRVIKSPFERPANPEPPALIPNSPFERPRNPEPMQLTPISALCAKLAALELTSPTSTIPKRKINLDVSCVANVDDDVSVLSSLSLSEDVEICDAEEAIDRDEGDMENPENAEDEDSFATAPGTPQDEEWRRVRPSFYIGGDEFVQEDAQVFLALRDGGFWTMEDTSSLYPAVHDWFFRILSKFTSREIEDMARRGLRQTSLSRPASWPGTPARSSPFPGSPMTPGFRSFLPNGPLRETELSGRASSVTSFALQSPGGQSPLPFSPCLALEAAFASPMQKAKRRSLIMH